jgi:acyl carrier protein
MSSNNNSFVKCFVDGLGIDINRVIEGLAYNTIPEWDSRGHMSLVVEIENAFNIMLDTDDIIGMSSVAEARRIIAKYGVEI